MGDPISSVLSIAGPAIGLGKSLFGGDKKPSGYNQISDLASSLGGQAKTLMSYITSGTLPPGLSGQLKQAGDAAKASTKSMYAAHGMSGGSSELTDLGNIDTKIAGQSADIAMNLLQTGINEAGLASGLYGDIMQESIREDSNLSGAITGFASSLAGFGGGGGGSAATGYTDAMGGQIPGIEGAAAGSSLWDTLASAGTDALAFLGL